MEFILSCSIWPATSGVVYFVYFINTNVQSEMRISHLESFSLVLFLKKLILFAENERLETNWNQ